MLMTVFEFIDQFFFQNEVFKLQEVFFSQSISIKNGLGCFQKFHILLGSRLTRDVLKISTETVLKTRLKIKEITYSLVYVKYLVVYLRSHSITAFSVSLEDLLRIISGICAGKNLKTKSCWVV
jgi:hypothetical protein